MIKNMHPADELAMVRADIDRLKSREAFLRRGFLDDTLPRRGDEAVVEIAVFRSRTCEYQAALAAHQARQITREASRFADETAPQEWRGIDQTHPKITRRAQ